MQCKFLTLAGLLCLSSLLFFCGKDDAEPVEESPFFDFFNETTINIDTTEQAADTWEYGFAFTPLKDGKITKLGIKLPASGNFTATLWDLSGPSPVALRTKSIDLSLQDVHANKYFNIPEIILKKDVKLGITILSNSFYRISKPGNGSFIFPRTFGNIRVESFNESVNNSSTPSFPPTTNEKRVAPCVNVIFIAD